MRRRRRAPTRVRSIDEAALPDGRPQRGERPAERAAGRLVVGVRPEHRRELVPGERSPLGRDERDDRERLARIDDDRSVGRR